MRSHDLPLSCLENRTRKLELGFLLVSFGWVFTSGFLILSEWLRPVEAQQTAASQSLRVSEIVVIDPKGVERVRIGGDLPDAVINGKPIPRGQKVAGVLLYDGTGQERSGYVTFEPSGNVGLTLDTRKRQSALFVSGPDEGSALQLWHENNLIEFRSDSDGTRLTSATNGKVVLQQPSIDRMSADTCEAYRDARSRTSKDQSFRDCRRRFREAVCNRCLSGRD